MNLKNASRPLVAVTTDVKDIGGHLSFAITRKYADPVLGISGCLPLLLPSFGAKLPLADVLDRVDGLLFTGSPSNVEPHHYGEALSDPDSLKDIERDATTLPLIPAAIARGIPILAICRGFQEINVAMGGLLHQAVHDVPGMQDHREDKTAPIATQYAPAHRVDAVKGGLLARIVGQSHWEVNSVHGQGIKRLADVLRAEAHAPDGLVEAYSHKTAPGFLLAVQWHPEWQADQNAVSVALFKAFGQACVTYAQNRANTQQGDVRVPG
ncbi:MAG: gamma-glutamyl-gamma-aminobutyrate hydrolase family protein [Burkholderiaceae bacterium]